MRLPLVGTEHSADYDQLQTFPLTSTGLLMEGHYQLVRCPQGFGNRPDRRGAFLPRNIEVRHGAHLARIDPVHQNAAGFERGR